MSEKKIITISREFGSGGRSIGRAVAERLGIPFYDRELVDHIAEESGFAPAFIETHGEHAPGNSVFAYAFNAHGVPGVMNGISAPDYLWNAQCKVILELADRGPCVIVGRNADYILKDRTDCLHVYIHASEEFRVKRIVDLYGEQEKSPQARIEEKDKRRKINYRHYTGRTWGQSQNYDISLCSSTFGLAKCADMIVDLYRGNGK